jgi:ATP-binding cassette subfamily C (CFTR/MRP) protein 1
MSALDATTKEIVFTSLLGFYFLLRKNSKTFVLGTNALCYLSSADRNIVSAAKGTIAEQGPYLKSRSSISAYLSARKKESRHNDHKVITLGILMET